MSDQQQNSFMELGAEERSDEESSMGDDTRDFFVDDKVSPIREPQVDSEALAAGPGVSISTTGGDRLGSGRCGWAKISGFNKSSVDKLQHASW